MGKTLIEIVDSRSFASAAADEIVLLMQDCIEENGVCCIALAGGSTPGSTYRLLGRPPRVSSIDWSKVKLFWGDERWVSHDNTQSNYRMTCETLINNLKIPSENIFPVDTSLGSPAEAAESYSKMISEVVKEANGLPSLDLVLLGIGEDGHTASLFPNQPALKSDADKYCVATTRPDGADRITLTRPLLQNAKNIIFLVGGEGKANIVQEVIEGQENFEKYPASFYHSAPGNVTWFLDSAAAKKLDKE